MTTARPGGAPAVPFGPFSPPRVRGLGERQRQALLNEFGY